VPLEIRENRNRIHESNQELAERTVLPPSPGPAMQAWRANNTSRLVQTWLPSSGEIKAIIQKEASLVGRKRERRDCGMREV